MFMIGRKGIVDAYLIGLVLVLGIVFVGGLVVFENVQKPGPSVPSGTSLSAVPKFENCNAITAAFKEASSQGIGGFGIMEKMAVGASSAPAPNAAGADTASQAQRYSETNVQVAGVDEADIVKTDGKFIYTVSPSLQTLSIVEAFPAESAVKLSSVKFDEKFSPNEIFIDGDIVLVFGSSYEDLSAQGASKSSVKCLDCYPYRSSFTTVQLWNVSDKQNPVLEKTLDFEGSYVTSRKINDIVYFVINSYPDYRILEETLPMPLTAESIVPKFRESTANATGSFEPVAKCGEIGYFEPVQAEQFVTVASISMSDLQAPVKKQVIVGSGQNVFASLQNLYVAEVNYNYPQPLPLVKTVTGSPIVREASESTIIHKFALSNGEISYKGLMNAPGRVLNQFSMDEFEGYFRIATTIGHVSRSAQEATSSNSIYVFNSELQSVGKLEDLAPGEQIYSARFIGKRAYLVTFKKVDPFFVIDLSDPSKPEVLGKLKIPGFSDYLHPFDETHIIGVGKETIEAESGDFAWYQGMKIALFDVSDVANPKELHKVVIGDRGTDSYALQDHKAFLFDREKELLVLPVQLAVIPEERKTQQRNQDWPEYGDFVFQGAYVYNLSLENGFQLKGRITHVSSDDSFKKSGYYYYNDWESVKRSLFIDNVLYTISDGKILANSLSDLSLIKEVKLGEKPDSTFYPMVE